jgi:hypothetical protein
VQVTVEMWKGREKDPAVGKEGRKEKRKNGRQQMENAVFSEGCALWTTRNRSREDDSMEHGKKRCHIFMQGPC